MLKTIAAASTELTQFVDTLRLPLNTPQHRHIMQIADGLITTQGSKTLSALYRHIVGDPCPKSAADTFRGAPWQADNIRTPLRRHLIQTAFEVAEEQGIPIIPDGYTVYLLCDSWYSAASLIGWCRDQEWHVICRLKSNRSLDDVSVRQHHQRHKHRPYTRVRVRAADEKRAKTYLVRSLTGELSNLSDDIRVFISQRHNGDSYPRYYCCTDLSLSANDALDGFLNRWSCEVANWYIAERLGWADCRLWRVEATEKFLMVLWLAMAYLEYRLVTEAAHTNLADVIRSHRQDHAVRLLQQACTMVLQMGEASQVLARYTLTPAPT